MNLPLAYNRVLGRHAARRGAAAVQFSFALTLIFLLFIAAVEYSRVHTLQHTLHDAAYQAARAATAPGCGANNARSTAADVLSRAGVRFANITVSPDPILESTPSVRVRIDLPVPQNSWVMPRFTQGTVLHSEATLLTERPAHIHRAALPKLPPPLREQSVAE